MPELPEVETSRRGIAPHLLGQTVRQVLVRQPRLRWSVSPDLAEGLTGQRIRALDRRGKYLLLRTDRGSLILHLGMSGSLRILTQETPPGRHDHLDLAFTECRLRFHDPRRFGALLWTRQDPLAHPLLAALGPEPLSDAFDAGYLYQRCLGRRAPIKSLLMDGREVAGIGNIYANEALFAAAIHPARAANALSNQDCIRLVAAVKAVLAQAIEQGGTTLRDFMREDGRPGYFAQQLKVYGRAGAPCPVCAETIEPLRQGQRSSFYCPRCQRD